MDKIDEIAVEMRMVKVALLGEPELNVKGMKQQLIEMQLSNDVRLGVIESDVAFLKKKERKRTRWGYIAKGAGAGAIFTAGAAGKAFWVKILTFLSGLLISIISLGFIYILL